MTLLKLAPLAKGTKFPGPHETLITRHGELIGILLRHVDDIQYG